MHFLSFWAKTRQTADGITETHALVCHLLDVAAVADVLLERFPKRLERLAALLDADATELRGLIVRLAALHDLGKFHPDFQRKLEGHCEQHLPELVKYINPKENPIRHDILGFMIAEQIDLNGRFRAQLPGLLTSEIEGLFRSVMLHHGRPAERPQNATTWLNSMNAIKPAILDYIDEAFALIPCDGPILRSEPSEEQLAAFSWALAGLIVLADWIGSNEEYFEYRDHVEDLSEYWREARRQAAEAVEKIGILPAAARESFDPSDLLPKAPGKRAELSPLQKAAATIHIADGPNLFIVEDMTGAGKTEAALILAERLLAAEAASGLYFALPTMATSNAMYGRMASVYRGSVRGGCAPVARARAWPPRSERQVHGVDLRCWRAKAGKRRRAGRRRRSGATRLHALDRRRSAQGLLRSRWRRHRRPGASRGASAQASGASPVGARRPRFDRGRSACLRCLCFSRA